MRDLGRARSSCPAIQRIVGVSGELTPCQWHVETDRGPTEFQLGSEEDVRRLGAYA